MNEYSFVISLRVFGGGILYRELIENIGIPAKSSQRAGEPRFDPKGNVLGGVYSVDYCSIDLPTLRGYSLPAALEKHVEFLRFHSELFAAIGQSAGRSELFVGWFGDRNFGDTFSSNLLRQLSELQIDLSLDIYAGNLPLTASE